MSTTNRTTLIGLLVIVAGLCGCAATGLRLAPQDMTSIDPDKAIVIFSVAAAEFVEEQNLELSWMGENGARQFGSIKQKPSSDPVRIFALEIPGDRLALRTMKIKVDSEWWQTTEQKELELVMGQVTYAGRIELQDIRFFEVFEGRANRKTGERKKALRPDSVKFVFSDQSESDLSNLRTEYSLLDGQTVARRIPQEWGHRSHVALATVPKNNNSDAGWIFLEFLAALLSSLPPISL